MNAIIPHYADATGGNVIRLHPDAREPCAELSATLLAERAALVLMTGADLSAGYRAELIRAAADGDVGRALDAITEWAAREARR